MYFSISPVAVLTFILSLAGAVLVEDQLEIPKVDEIDDRNVLKNRILAHGHPSKVPTPKICPCECHKPVPTPWTTTTRKPITTTTSRPVTTTTLNPVTTSTRKPTTTSTRRPITTTTLKPVTTTTPKPGHCHCPACPATTTPKPTSKPCVCHCPVTTPKPTPKPCHCPCPITKQKPTPKPCDCSCPVVTPKPCFCPCHAPVTRDHHGCATPVPPKPCVGKHCCPAENGASPVYISHPTNPKIFFECSWGLAYVFYCPNDTVLNIDLNICVHQQ